MAGCSIWGYQIHIEVPVVLVFFAFMLSDSVKTNLIIYRTCYVTLGYNESECALLGSKHPDNETADLERIVEPHASVINMALSLVDAAFSAALCLFLGPWSDKFGRKPVLIAPLIGFSLSYILVAIFSTLPSLSAWYLFVCSAPVLLTGGFSSYLTVLLCYITDVTSESDRGMRMGVFEALIGLGILLGNLLTASIFYMAGYTTVFAISGICCALGLLYTLFFIPESVINLEDENSIQAIFHLSNVGDMMKTTFKKRPQYERCTILCCVLLLTLSIIVLNADSSVIFLYLREKLHWSLEKYTLYNVLHNTSWILSTIIGIYVLHKLMKIPETVLILIGYISMLNGSLLQGLATKDAVIYASGVVRSLGALLSPMLRSLVTKIVSGEETGKILSLIVISESLFGMIGSPLYTTIYNATIQTDPSIFNFVTAGITLFQLMVAIFVVIMRTWKRSEDYRQLVANEENAEDSISGDATVSSA